MLEQKVKIKIGGDYSPIPADKYTVQISDINLIKSFNKFKGIEEELLNFTFIILDDKPIDESEETTRGRLLWQRCTMTLGKKSKLGKLAVAVIGRELTKDEMEAFDPSDLVGKQINAMVVQNPSADGTIIYNNILDVSKTTKPLPAIDAQVAQAAGVLHKKTVPAVAPDAENPDAFIAKMEDEAKVGAKTKVGALTEDAAELIPEEVEARAAEAHAALLAAASARARAEAARKKARMARAN